MAERGEKNRASVSSQRTLLPRVVNEEWYDRARVYAFHIKEFLRCTTPRKLGNLVLVKSQRLLRRDHVLGMPAYYFIDPINICNLRCPLCPTGRGTLARPRGRMTVPLLKRIVDEIAPYAYRVELYNWGEPMLHPEIFDMIEYASQRRVAVGLSSNLNRLDAAMAHRLVESGLSQLVLSIDGATQETYSAYRRLGQLDRVLENLKLLLETKHSLGSHTPFVIWRMLVGKHNEHEIEDVRDLAHTMGVDVFTTGVLFVDTRKRQETEQWVPSNPDYSSYDYSGGDLENQWDCHELWETMVINWDGGVAPCCWLHDHRYDFANVTSQTIREIWTGPRYVSARRTRAGREKLPDHTDSICDLCRGKPSYLEY
jgi:MoaA/NifB/PqqE/SkfB family radical SAM enzyme